MWLDSSMYKTKEKKKKGQRKLVGVEIFYFFNDHGKIGLNKTIS